MAVKVTDVPGQIVVWLAAMLTDAGFNGFTVMEMVLLVAGLPVAQGDALEVSTTVTWSLLLSVELVNVALLVPTLDPFTFHW